MSAPARFAGFCSAAWNASGLPPRIARWASGGLAVLGLLAGAAACAQVDLRAGELLSALAILALGVLPPGYLLTRNLARELWRRPVERCGLALLCGWPVLAAGHYLLALAGFERALPVAIGLVATLAAAVAWRSPRGARRARFGLVDAALVALVGLCLLATTRDFRAFRGTPAGLAYDHTLEHAIHVAFYWELLRGVPPRELPTAAGVEFPHYHVLGYLPGALVSRQTGLGPITLYHALVPLWHLTLLALALHLAVTARSGRVELSFAALTGLFFVVNTLDGAFASEAFAARVPLEFFSRAVSGGAGIVLWVTVAALLAAAQRPPGDPAPQESRGPLLLAAALAGLSYGVKAQMFLLLGAALLLALGVLALSGRRRAALEAALLFALCAAPLALSWRTAFKLGALQWAPGLFAREAGTAKLLAGLGSPAAWLLGTPLALWSMLHFTPLYPAFAARSLARARRAPLLDVFLAGALVSALLLASGFALQEPQPGEVSALFVREAFYAVQVGAVAVDVALLAWCASRLSAGALDGARCALALVLSVALGLLPLLAVTPTHRGPREGLVLSAAEQGALRYLRQNAPADAVVAQARTLSQRWPDPAARGLDRVPVVAALAGRRSVLEYYRPDIDPEVNRLRLLRSLFSTQDRAKGESILRRFRVDYVLEFSELPLRFASPRLRPVYAAGQVRLLRFEPAPDPGRSRPAPLPAPDELR